jgi:hypothetical protein
MLSGILSKNILIIVVLYSLSPSANSFNISRSIETVVTASGALTPKLAVLGLDGGGALKISSSILYKLSKPLPTMSKPAPVTVSEWVISF